VLLARWLLTKPKVIMFDEPTKGIDVGAKSELYDVINDLARQGLAVIVVSSYLPELLGLADRVLVLRDEAIAGELPAGASEEAVLQLASGGVVAIGEAERDHLHGIPGMVNDPHFNPVIHQNIEKVSNA
jgi:ABC-type sugar transport system ATPase subunit